MKAETFMINFYDKTVLRDDYTTGCLLHYQYFKQHYEIISVDLSKQEEFVYPKVIKQTKFYGMLKKIHKYTQF